MKIASWNVNSIKVRGPQVLDWLKSSETDILFMQEIKSMDENFPVELFTDAGYDIHVHGQKSYNGVAVASRIPLDDVRRGMPRLDDSMEDEQARYIEVDTHGMTIGGLYMPNGNPVLADDGGVHPKLVYKLDWMKRLHAHAARLNQQGRPVVFTGDFNIIPEARDCWDIGVWRGDALHHPDTLAAFRAFSYLGYTDIWRAFNPNAIAYSFWDYQGGAWQKDHGIRIDHVMANAEASDKVLEVGIDKTPRGNDRASDHTPIWCRFRI
ncbi:MAG: exodeoxyribonuclease III [Alphaproteobacteria bacterium]|nr:exodeoxyribonuclease III [Alphaproteobacteria bacterium]